MRVISIYTDGACSKVGQGGWAFALDGSDVATAGFEDPTTSNRMELTAAIRALESIDVQGEVEIVTDSRYVMDGFVKGWVANWIRTGWFRSDGSPTLNRDLWEELYAQVNKKYAVRWVWVRAHSGNPMNELVDLTAKAQVFAAARQRTFSMVPRG